MLVNSFKTTMCFKRLILDMCRNFLNILHEALFIMCIIVFDTFWFLVKCVDPQYWILGFKTWTNGSELVNISDFLRYAHRNNSPMAKKSVAGNHFCHRKTNMRPENRSLKRRHAATHR